MGLTQTQSTAGSERRGPGQGGRAFRILIALVLGMSAITIGGGILRNAAAVTTWPNATGWQGNQAIYMNTKIYGTGTDQMGFGNYALPEWNVSSPAQTKDVVVVPNSVGVAVGVRSTDGGGNVYFYEYYDTGAGSLDVHIPIAVIGATYTNYSTDVECVYASVRNNYLSHENMNIKWGDNFAINATGTLDQGTSAITNAQNDLMADAFWAGAEALPGVGTVHSWASMYQTYLETAKAVGSPNIEGFQSTSAAGLQVIQSYNVINQTAWLHNSQSPTYDVYGSSMYVEIDINKTMFATYPSSSTNYTFTVMGKNWVGFWGNGCISGNVLGAWMPLNIFAYPATEVEGTVSLGSRTLANQPLTLSDGGSNVYTFSTNSQGNYRFFAKPGTAYTLSTTYGGVQYQNSTTTGTDPTGPAQYLDLQVPALSTTAVAGPNPTQPGVSVGFQATLSGGILYPVNITWNFGDGTWGWDQTPSHVYGASGTYDANVTVKDSSSPQQTARSTVAVVVQKPNCSSACINPATQTVYYGTCYVPRASFSGFPAASDVGPFTYSWAFGDGGTGTGQTVQHTYPFIAKTYTVTLTITDGNGTKSTPTATVTVQNAGKICAPG